MAYSFADIPAAELAFTGADKPMLIGRNWGRDASDIRWNTVGTIATADASDTGWDAAFVADDHDHVQSRPSSTAATWYLVFDLGSGGVAELDSLVILNHNIGTLGATVTLEIGDTDFGAAVVQLASESPSDDKRIVWVDLDHTSTVPQRYTSVQYARLKITGSSIQPQIGEVILGRRRQLRHKPIVPWDDLQQRSSVIDVVTLSGVHSRNILNKGQRLIRASMHAATAAAISDIQTFFAETDYGCRPFMWIDEPDTDATQAWWMALDQPELTGPVLGFIRRIYPINASEKGPNYLSAGT